MGSYTSHIESLTFIRYYKWGNNLLQLAKLKKGIEKEELINNSIQKYKKAIELNPEFGNPYYNLESALVYLSKMKSGNARNNLSNLVQPISNR